MSLSRVFRFSGWLLLALVVGWGCSAERKGPVGRAYHNVAARDNGYFLAREKLKEVRATLLADMVSDYNKTLPIFPPLTETEVTKINADLEDIVKKASLPIQRHKTSDWVDDAYLLIGKARFYKMEFDDATKTFKYVNTTGKTSEVRHEALIWLMRSFIQLKELDNAVAVSDLLDKEKGSPDNARDLFLTRAQLHLLRGETPEAITNLRLAIPEIDGKNERSRIRFILAQLYQQTEQPRLAYEQYTRILRRNPPYELGFFTKLNLAQVTELSSTSERAKLDKYFRKLLKDFKNVEYRDRIYYEMARLEYRQQNYNKALDLLQLASKASANNQLQKAYGYLFAGRISYENLRNFRLAARYYDSLVQVLPKEAPEYEAAAERRDILKDFSTQIDIVDRQDSLQTLARLDTAALRQRIDAMVQTELDRQEAERKQQEILAKAAERNSLAPAATFGNQFGATNPTGLDIGTAAAGGVWYFDNPTALAGARADFIRRWGNRTLQDHWRLASTSQRNPASADKTGGLGDGVAQIDSAAAVDPAVAAAAVARELRATYMRDIPATPEQLQASNEQLEAALFELAKIYNQRLKELEPAEKSYARLVGQFPQSTHAPESYYALYLLAQNRGDAAKQAEYANALRTRFPKSEYALLVDEPGYRQRAARENLIVHVLYDSAYALYQDGLYPKARTVVTNTTVKYPINDISDKLSVLNALIAAHIEGPAQYKTSLEQFKTDYPASPLLGRVDTLLATIQLYESGKLNAPEPDSASGTVAVSNTGLPAINYVVDKSSPHLVLIAYPRGAAGFNDILTLYANYNNANYSSDKLQVSPLLFGEQTSLAMIKSFPDSRAAMNYAARQRLPTSPLGQIRDVAYQIVVIAQKNLPAFYQARDIDGYQAFYEQNYVQ